MKLSIQLKSLLCLSGLLPAVAGAAELPIGVITHVGDPVFKDQKVYCEEDLEEPLANDFKALDYNVMSSEDGHRYALMTIKNTSAGQRIFTNEHLVAIYANCTSRFPQSFKQKLSGGQITTKTVYFGVSEYPIVKVILEKED